MKQVIKGTLFIIELNDLDSAFIRQIIYDSKNEMLSVVLKNKNVYNYINVPIEVFVEFSVSKSFGSFYNNNIKNKFKHLTMAEKANSSGKQQPNRINKAGDFKRFIRMSIDVTKLKKDWFYVSKNEDGSTKAVYLKMTLMMLPDGETDKFGQLGFIVQDVPKEIFEQDRKAKGDILGNAEELEWKKEEEKVELISNDEDDDIMSGLPF